MPCKACICRTEPRGDYGLEGFQRGEVYPYQAAYSPEGKLHYRVWPSYDTWPDYYETCSPQAFNKHFEAI